MSIVTIKQISRAAYVAVIREINYFGSFYLFIDLTSTIVK